jgi:hypothetical protein
LQKKPYNLAKSIEELFAKRRRNEAALPFAKANGSKRSLRRRGYDDFFGFEEVDKKKTE